MQLGTTLLSPTIRPSLYSTKVSQKNATRDGAKTRRSRNTGRPGSQTAPVNVRPEGQILRNGDHHIIDVGTVEYTTASAGEAPLEADRLPEGGGGNSGGTDRLPRG